MKINWQGLLNSQRFKRATLLLGIIFIFFSGLITYRPQPFLRFGYLGVFVFNLFGPGALLIPTLSRYMNIWLLAAVTAAGMALNDSVSWWVGRRGEMLFPKSTKARKLETMIQKHGVIGLFFWALIPFPYDFVGAIAGYLGIPYFKFFAPTFLGRFIRMVLFGLGVVSIFGKLP